MAARLDAWSAKDREAFWTFVRGRMAERRLNQEQVASAIGISRTGLSRRDSGEVKERPNKWMVSQLADLLKLDEAECEQLRRLAGYAGPGGQRVPLDRAMVRVVTEPSATEDASAEPVSADEPVPRSHRTLPARAVWAAVAAGLVAVVAVAAILVDWLAPVRPGGVWAGPLSIEPESGRIHITARAYPASRASPPVNYVEFTASWAERPGPWLIACRVAAPAHTDLYECDWDPTAVGVPPGPLRVSFDVYDAAGNVNLAPHGVRSFTYARTTP